MVSLSFDSSGHQHHQRDDDVELALVLLSQIDLFEGHRWVVGLGDLRSASLPSTPMTSAPLA
jgi:hypothetical protein